MHETFLLAALEQAQMGKGFCAPNPSVGAVAVDKCGNIIAKAYHKGAGHAHAEQLVIDDIEKHHTDITLYVTLEPCNHWGKTPPCVDAISKSCISRVIYAYADPNPVIRANNTPKILHDRHIEVIHHPLSAINAFYESYHYWTKTNLPLVTIKMAQSLDGKIASVHGQPIKISNDACDLLTHQYRKSSDVIITSAKTIMQDNPLMNARINGTSIAKPIAIIDANLALQADYRIFSHNQSFYIFYSNLLPPPDSPIENCQYFPIPIDNNGLIMNDVYQRLGALGFHDAWVEVGGRLFSHIVHHRLAHEVLLYIAPIFLGKDATPGYVLNHYEAMSCVKKWQIVEDNMVLYLALNTKAHE